MVSVKLDECNGSTGLWLLEPDLDLELSRLYMEPSLLEDLQQKPRVLVTNSTGFTQQLEQGFHLHVGTVERIQAICGTPQLASERSMSGESPQT